MADPQINRITLDRIILLGIGAIAGAATFGLIEILPDLVKNDRLGLLIVAATGGFFSALMAATGPLSLGRAALTAALASLPAALLLVWASFRFAKIKDFLESAHPTFAFILILTVLLPFLIAAQRPGEGWRNYPALFTQSWNIVVRYCAAWVFTGVFWGVVFLSDALFGLVGLDIIERILSVTWVPYVLTGAVLGLGLAVVVELSDYVSPFLILRLLRLLMPMILVVTVVFLAALPVQGLSDLFGGLSAAATLMGMAFGIATLITSAIDRYDDEAVQAPAMRLSAQALALAMPVLAALSVYAIWIRVQDYGWTPARLAAVSVGLIMVGYALLYALSVLSGRDWMARIRAANIVMALVTVGVSVLWLTPVINPQRISANNQIARFDSGKVTAAELDLWFIAHDLGVAGTAALDRLAAMPHPESDALNARIQQLAAARNRRAFERNVETVDLPALIAGIEAAVTVLPKGTPLPKDTFIGGSTAQWENFADGCHRKTPAGNAGCVLVLADFVESEPGIEGMMIYMNSDHNATLDVVWPGNATPPYTRPIFMRGQDGADIKPDTLDGLLEGVFDLAPVQIMSLDLGTAQIILKP